MNKDTDPVVPAGASHFKQIYGNTHYYKRTERPHLNQVSEEWQTFIQWFWWDTFTKQWVAAESGFCSRNLKPLNPPE